MKIRIKVLLDDLPEYVRPRVGYIFNVIETKYAGYNPIENNIKIIECRGVKIPILASECEVL